MHLPDYYTRNRCTAKGKVKYTEHAKDAMHASPNLTASRRSLVLV
jgi:hypothetical protein